jgi:acyl-CoA thioester hydrolase
MAMFKRNIGFVVSRYEIDYLWSLYGGDEFVIETAMERISRLQVEFVQNIYRLPDRKPIVRCKNVGLPINVAQNKAQWPPELDELLKDFPIRQKISADLNQRLSKPINP